MAVIDKVSYGRLLVKTLPSVIDTDAEHERLTAEFRCPQCLQNNASWQNC